MRRILSILKFDLSNALRDSMILYILAGPLILALALRLLAPAVEGGSAVFAVEVSSPAGAALAGALEAYGRVERFADAEELRRRVDGPDDAAGVLPGPAEGAAELLLEGDEGSEAAELFAAVLAAAIDGEKAVYELSVRPGGHAGFAEYGRACLAMLAVLLGGVAAAFALVEEKEAKATRAFAVSPISAGEYFAARGLWAGAAGLTGALVGHLVAGGNEVSFWRFGLALASSAFMPLAICLLIGGIAANQIQAVASLKIVMLVYLSVPLASVFVPVSWRFLFWIFPNYWVFKAFEGAYVPGVDGFGLSAALAVLLGAALVIGLGIALAPRLSPRRSGG